MNSTTSKVRIFIVDDHVLFREGIARLLNEEPDFEVVGDCGTIREALQVISATDVDVVLLDFDLGEKTGAEFFAEAKPIGFRGKVLILTAGLSEIEGVKLIRDGASGILMKHNSAIALSEGIREIMRGRIWLEQQYLRTIVDASLDEKRNAPAQTQQLSLRERQVLSCILGGLTNKQIAERLDTSEGSIKSSVQQLFDKTGVRTRSQLVRLALDRCWDEEHFQ